MQKFTLGPEPSYFDKQVRQKGLRFINKYATPKKYPAHWSKCQECAQDVRSAFRSLCGYSVIFCDDGHVDHFISQNECCEMSQRHLIYEWSNYRYANPIVNQSKNAARSSDLLDPCEVEDEWFRVILPTGKLEITQKIPDRFLDRAENTIKLLHLNEGKVLERRQNLIRGFINGKFTLEHVDETAPIIALELRQKIYAVNQMPVNCHLALILEGKATMGELSRSAPDIHNLVICAIYS